MPCRPALRPAVVAALAAALATPAVATSGNPALTGGPGRPSPIFRPEQVGHAPRAQLLYLGGRVLSNVRLVMVRWGAGPFAPYVSGDASPSLPAFLAAVAGSPFVAGLAEYDTAREAVGGAPGTGQHVGPGTFGGVFPIAPASRADVVDDAVIAAELVDQLDRGALPAPRADAAGRLETLYLVYFPAGMRVTLGADESCRTFCAYHGAFRWRGKAVPYAVMPDLSPGSGCDLRCGGGAGFASAAAVVTHELAEAITDPDVSLGDGVGPPLAWYDPVNGEIGDICVGELGTVTGTDGAEWPVQRVWSNAQGACVVPEAGVVAAPLVASAPAPSAPAAAPALVAAPVAPAGPAPRRAAVLVALPPQAPPAGSGAAAFPRALPSEPTPLPFSRNVRVALEEENDALAVARHRTDDLYTQGLRLSARWALRDGDGAAGPVREIGFAVGQNIYTPTDIRTTDLAALRRDRPYAGWLYAALLLRSRDDAPDTARLGADAANPGEATTELEIAVGVTGPQAGGAAVQTRFHALLRQWSGSAASPPDPAGWSVYQTASRPTLDTSVRHQVDLVQASAWLGETTDLTGAVLGMRLSPRGRLDIGTTFDAASLGLELRAGLLAPGRRRFAPSFPLELYGFARADGRYVVRNALIDGQLRNGVIQLVVARPWVADLEVGAVLRLGGLELGFGELWRTSELSPTPPGAGGLHAVGQVTVAWVAP
jgi:hypothetical protein